MTHAAELPPAIAVLTALLVLVGAALTLVGAFGLLRLKTFYERVHAPTLGTTLGTGCVLIASIVLFSALESASGVASELYEKVSESSVHAFAAPADGDSEGESVNKTARRSARAARTTAAGSEAGEAVISDGEN